MLVTYEASFRCTQKQICLCGPSGGVSHEVVLQILDVSSFAFIVTHFERYVAVSFVQCVSDVQIEANSLTAAAFDAPLLHFKDGDFVQIIAQQSQFTQVPLAGKL